MLRILKLGSVDGFSELRYSFFICHVILNCILEILNNIGCWILVKCLENSIIIKIATQQVVGLDRFRPKIPTCFLWAVSPLSVLLASVLPGHLQGDSLVRVSSLLVQSSESSVFTIGSDPCMYRSRVSPEVHKQLYNC